LLEEPRDARAVASYWPPASRDRDPPCRQGYSLAPGLSPPPPPRLAAPAAGTAHRGDRQLAGNAIVRNAPSRPCL